VYPAKPASRLHLPIVATCVATVALAGPVTAGAQALEEVIVTAQKRVESAQDVPIAIHAISGEQLRVTGAGNLEGLSDSIPNVDVADSPGLTRVVIRGLGSGTGNAGFEQSVGMFVDGIYASRAALFQSPFLDLERIEVLKGPQGVLFGKNSIAGALSLVSNRPTDMFEGEVTGAYDFEYGSRETTGFVSGPLRDNLAGRLALRASEDADYMDDQLLDDGVPDTDTGVIRGMLQWDATDTTRVLLKLESSKFKEHGTNWQVFADDSPGTFPWLLDNDPAYVPPTPNLALGAAVYRQARLAGEDFAYDDDSFINEAEDLQQDADTLTFEVTRDLYDQELVYLFGYGEYDREQLADQDFTAVAVAATGRDENFEQSSHELRIASPQGQVLDYIAGLYYLDRELRIDTVQDGMGFNPALAFSSDAAYEETATSWAAFGQLTWNITDSLRSSLGLRYSEEDKDATSAWLNRVFQSDASLAEQDPAKYALIENLLNRRDFSYGDERNEDKLDPAFSVQWGFSDAGMAYISWVQASKAGGFNTNEGSGDIALFSFDPEQAESVEVGVKMDLLDGRARLNMAVFHTVFDDLQVGAFDPAVNSFVVRNAAQARSQGVELESLYALGKGFTLGGNAAYLEAQYRDFTASCPANQVQAARLDCYPNPDGPATNLVQDLDGVQMDNAPEVTAALFADYTVPVTAGLLLGGRLDATYKDETSLDFSQDENLFANDYWRYNLRLSLASMAGNWNTAFTVFNLTDEQPPNFGGQEFLLPGVYWQNRGRGREVELSVTWRFGG